MNWDDMSEEQRKQMTERFEQRRQEMKREQNQRLRDDLELSEEEFEVLSPMVDQVRQLSNESMVAGRNFFGGRGGRGFNPFGQDADMSSQGKAVSEASTALRELLEAEEVGSDQIIDKLNTLRRARAEHQDALRQAREDLRELLTPLQEAKLVLQGMLD